MNKAIKRLLCLVSVVAVFMLISIFAFADAANISVAAVKNGEVIVSEENGKAIIEAIPNEGYITASVKLGLRYLSPSDVNVYTCDIPSKSTELQVSFRRARLELSKDELAMNTGDTEKISSYISYIDGDIITRVPVKNNDVVYTSSDPDVVSVDANGIFTAKKMGYARINASAVSGNGVESFFYIIVDGDKSPVMGTIQLNAYFLEKEILGGLDNFHPGHSFLIITNTSGKDITFNTENMFMCKIPTQKFYDAVNSYNGEGYDPLTYFYATNGEPECSDNAEIRAAYADSGFFDIYKRGELKTHTIKNNDIVTIGNTGNDGIPEILSGDIGETITRLGLTGAFDDLSNILKAARNINFFVIKMTRLLAEVGIDSTFGFNPINGHTENGGVCVDAEIYSQMKSRDYTVAAACRTAITELQFEAMIDFAQYENYFTILGRNCTLFASDAWNLVTAANPKYHMEPDVGGVTNAFAAPMFLRNRILASAPLFALDKNIEFFDGIDVIKPPKAACADCEHSFALTDAKITKAGKLVCADCGAEAEGTTLTEMSLKLGSGYNEGVLGVWRTSDPKVAIVTTTGFILPLSSGTTTISCTKGSTTYSCVLTVE